MMPTTPELTEKHRANLEALQLLMTQPHTTSVDQRVAQVLAQVPAHVRWPTLAPNPTGGFGEYPPNSNTNSLPSSNHGLSTNAPLTVVAAAPLSVYSQAPS
jgi:hypothetical protein